ncbi:MAG: hypothetical protein IPQ13_03220 [Holophagaceae bacterium]|nr:hypothetical protein [Holophagaceae bacterium]
MNSRWASLLVLPALGSPAPPPDAPRANKVELGGTSYQFQPLKLILSTPSVQMKGKRMFRLSGRLVPAAGEAVAMELTASETGSIYLLKLTRPRGSGQDVWAATLKTKVQVQELQAKAGGALRLELSGPLAATLEKGGGFTHWNGGILARFNGVSE